MIILSFLLFCISLILFMKYKTEGKMSIFIYSSFVLLFFLLTDTYYILNYFTGNGLDNSALYFFRYGGEGTGWLEYKFIIFMGILSIFFSIILLYLYFFYYLKFPKKDKKYIIFFRKLSYVFLFFSLLFHPLVNNILEINGFYDEGLANNGLSFNDFYVKPEFKDIEKKKNIIFIYLESYEKLYLDENIFPGLANGLNDLKNNSVYFDNLFQSYGASWTIGGMVASQCGIPLQIPGNFNNSDKNNSYLSGAYCIGDYLKMAGYDLNYMGGSSLSFAGKGNFYKTHGFNSLEGKEELFNNSNEDYINSWGLYDDTIFNSFYDKYDELSKKDKPFGLFMISMDTHGDTGVISDSCKDYPYNNDKNSILNSYHCTDLLLSQFIDKIKSSKTFDNTVIVIASDHYVMENNDSFDIISKNKDNRGLLFMIYDSDKSNDKIVDKKGDTLDIGATVLSFLGFKVDKLGLGINLLNNDIIRNPKIVLSKWKKDYENFWN